MKNKFYTDEIAIRDTIPNGTGVERSYPAGNKVGKQATITSERFLAISASAAVRRATDLAAEKEIIQMK